MGFGGRGRSRCWCSRQRGARGDLPARKLAELYAKYRAQAPAERERLYLEIKAVQAEPLRR